MNEAYCIDDRAQGETSDVCSLERTKKHLDIESRSNKPESLVIFETRHIFYTKESSLSFEDPIGISRKGVQQDDGGDYYKLTQQHNFDDDTYLGDHIDYPHLAALPSNDARWDERAYIQSVSSYNTMPYSELVHDPKASEACRRFASESPVATSRCWPDVPFDNIGSCLLMNSRPHPDGDPSRPSDARRGGRLYGDMGGHRGYDGQLESTTLDPYRVGRPTNGSAGRAPSAISLGPPISMKTSRTGTTCHRLRRCHERPGSPR